MRSSPATLLLSLLFLSCSDEPAASGGVEGGTGGAGGAAGSGGSGGGAGSGGSAGQGGSGGAPCLPSCGGRSCGDDGCGTACGSCGPGSSCDVAGSCVPTACPAGCGADCPQGCFDPGPCDPGPGLTVTPAVRTAGVVWSSGAEAEVYHRPVNGSLWWRDTDAASLPDGRVASSIFSLAPATAYELLLVAGGTRACARFSTLPVDPVHETSATLLVEAGAAPGGDGSAAAPFASIQEAVDAAGPGVDVLVGAGLYHEEVRLSSGGEARRYLRLLGAPGAILDGADAGVAASGLPWTDEGGGVYSAPWDGSPAYVSRDGQRSYHYTSLAGLQAGLGDDDVPIDEGWFVQGGRLLVRSLDSPAAHSWQLPRLNTAFALDGAAFVWIEGFEVRFYGEGEYPKGIDVRASSEVVIRGNLIHEVSSPIWIRRGGDHVRVEGNRIHQSNVHLWPWAAVKGTDHENTAVAASGGTATIVSGNSIQAIFNGVGTGDFSADQDPAISFDVDVYENRFADIGDDVLEPEGACVNNRFWSNSADRLLNGLSLAPITFGPVFAVRNRFTDYQESGFKVSNGSTGRVWLFHNSCFTDRPDHDGMGVSGDFTNMVFRNNLIRGTAYALQMSRTASPNDLDHDALFTTRGAPVIKWSNVRYDSLAELCAATGLECHGIGADPLLLDPAAGRFGPRDGSPLVDAAARLYGVNDLDGTPADVGYVELGGAEIPPL